MLTSNSDIIEDWGAIDTDGFTDPSLILLILKPVNNDRNMGAIETFRRTRLVASRPRRDSKPGPLDLQPLT